MTVETDHWKALQLEQSVTKYGCTIVYKIRVQTAANAIMKKCATFQHTASKPPNNTVWISSDNRPTENGKASIQKWTQFTAIIYAAQNRDAKIQWASQMTDVQVHKMDAIHVWLMESGCKDWESESNDMCKYICSAIRTTKRNVTERSNHVNNSDNVCMIFSISSCLHPPEWHVHCWWQTGYHTASRHHRSPQMTMTCSAFCHAPAEHDSPGTIMQSI